jgi:hypothetical protein
MVEGRYIIYDAMEINHDEDAGVHDTVHFQLKTVVGQNYTDNEGRIGKVYLRYKSVNSGLTWQYTDTWTQFSTSNRAELVEENQKIVKMIFAPKLNIEWDINAYNAWPEQFAFYSDVHQPFLIGSFNFDSTATVVQKDFFSLVDLQKQSEVYAKNVGLIQKIYKDLIIENFDTLQPQKGKEIFYNLIDFGFE